MIQTRFPWGFNLCLKSCSAAIIAPVKLTRRHCRQLLDCCSIVRFSVAVSLVVVVAAATFFLCFFWRLCVARRSARDFCATLRILFGRRVTQSPENVWHSHVIAAATSPAPRRGDYVPVCVPNESSGGLQSSGCELRKHSRNSRRGAHSSRKRAHVSSRPVLLRRVGRRSADNCAQREHAIGGEHRPCGRRPATSQKRPPTRSRCALSATLSTDDRHLLAVLRHLLLTGHPCRINSPAVFRTTHASQVVLGRPLLAVTFLSFCFFLLIFFAGGFFTSTSAALANTGQSREAAGRFERGKNFRNSLPCRAFFRAFAQTSWLGASLAFFLREFLTFSHLMQRMWIAKWKRDTWIHNEFHNQKKKSWEIALSSFPRSF